MEEFIIDKEGRKRFKCDCAKCGTLLWRQRKQINRFPISTCEKCKCSKKVHRKEYLCEHCNNKVYRKESEVRSSSVFCNRSCAASFRNNSREPTDSRHTYRKRALKFYGAKCTNERCMVSQHQDIPEKMLDVDHIDNDRANNHISNLKVFCVWCHALKTRKNWN